MNTKKVPINEQLRKDIIQRRKELNLSSYKLSVASGHSKFWLSNIENGKTQKISIVDVLSIYRILLDSFDDTSTLLLLENILNQRLIQEDLTIYDLFHIENEILEMNDTETFLNEFNTLMEDIRNNLVKRLRSLNIKEQKAAVSTIYKLNLSSYLTPDLVFGLANISVYGVDPLNQEECSCAISDLLSLADKYSEMAIKNRSRELYNKYKELDKIYDEKDYQALMSAYESFDSLLSFLLEYKEFDKTEVYNILKNIYSSVINPIKSTIHFSLDSIFPFQYTIQTGKDFAALLGTCNEWFKSQNIDKDLPIINESISKNISAAQEFLCNIEKINHTGRTS